jgi:hypothetical protein
MDATTNGQPDLISTILTDHREALAVFDEVESGTRDPGRRRELTNRVTRYLLRHWLREELYLHPLVRKVLPDGEQIVRHDVAEHAEAARIMKELAGIDPRHPALDKPFDRLVRTLIAYVRRHIEDKESDLLPRLRGLCDPLELRELGTRFHRAEHTAPTPTPGLTSGGDESTDPQPPSPLFAPARAVFSAFVKGPYQLNGTETQRPDGGTTAR